MLGVHPGRESHDRYTSTRNLVNDVLIVQQETERAPGGEN